LVKARGIWNGIVTLYQDNKEFERQVQYARARLKGDKIDLIEFGAKPAAVSDDDSTPRAEKGNDRQKPPEKSE
jgi:hypothetical protein